MVTDKRREKIINTLKNSKNPITGTDLSKIFEVSRQVIVQDISVMRAKGYDILATSKGYILNLKDKKDKNIKTIICKHESYKDMEKELKIIIDMGAKVLDVIVDHPVYGEIKSPLIINSRMDIEDFMEKVKNKKAEPLSKLTGGEHIHTLEVPNNKAYKKIIQLLSEKGFLISK